MAPLPKPKNYENFSIVSSIQTEEKNKKIVLYKDMAGSGDTAVFFASSPEKNEWYVAKLYNEKEHKALELLDLYGGTFTDKSHLVYDNKLGNKTDKRMLIKFKPGKPFYLSKGVKDNEEYNRMDNDPNWQDSNSPWHLALSKINNMTQTAWRHIEKQLIEQAKAGILNYDLAARNILFDEKTGTASIIDFDKITLLSELEKKNNKKYSLGELEAKFEGVLNTFSLKLQQEINDKTVGEFLSNHPNDHMAYGWVEFSLKKIVDDKVESLSKKLAKEYQNQRDFKRIYESKDAPIDTKRSDVEVSSSLQHLNKNSTKIKKTNINHNEEEEEKQFDPIKQTKNLYRGPTKFPSTKTIKRQIDRGQSKTSVFTRKRIERKKVIREVLHHWVTSNNSFNELDDFLDNKNDKEKNKLPKITIKSRDSNNQYKFEYDNKSKKIIVKKKIHESHAGVLMNERKDIEEPLPKSTSETIDAMKSIVERIEEEEKVYLSHKNPKVPKNYT